MKTLLMLLVCLSFSPTLTDAKMYKWVDENGTTHFSNVAPPADAEVQTKAEAKGDPVAADNPSGSGLDEVLKSYRRDALQDRLDDAGKRSPSTSRPTKNIRDYERWAEKYRRDVDHWEQRLRDVKRESYSNKQDHEDKIRHCEKMLADYKSLLENAERRLQDAR